MISVCIPAYNYAHYLPAAIESCLASSVDFELVVLDNCSDDGTSELRPHYVGDSRVRWYRNETVLPVQTNWNRCVGLSTQPFIKLLQADDILLPGAIERYLHWVGTREGGMHSHLAIMVDEHGTEIRRQVPYTADREPLSVFGRVALRQKLRQVARAKEPSCNLFSRRAFDAIGGYSSELRFTFDIQFNIRVMERFGLTLWSEYWSGVRRHKGSDGAKLPPQLALNDLETVIYHILERLGDEVRASDRRAAGAWLQYRMLELTAQRIFVDPSVVLRFVFKNAKLFRNLNSIPGCLAMVLRRMRTGDVQKVLSRGRGVA